MNYTYKHETRSISPAAIAQRLGIQGQLTEQPKMRRTGDEITFSFPGATLTQQHKDQLDKIGRHLIANTGTA